MATMILPAGCVDSLLLFPSTEPITPGQPVQRREIPWDGGSVEVLVSVSGPTLQPHDPAGGQPPPTPAIVVVVLGGNAQRAEHALTGPRVATDISADWLDAHTAEVWHVNYPGYGRSTGPARLARLVPAATAVVQAAAMRAAGPPVMILGNSIGSAVALGVAAANPHLVRALILRNPPPLRALITGEYGWWNAGLLAGAVAGAVPDELDALLTAPRVGQPCVVLRAGRDSLVLAAYQQQVIDALAGPVTVIEMPHADHNTPPDDATETRLAELLDAWLATRTWQAGSPRP